MSNELKIEAGKYYRMRNKQRATVVRSDKPGDRPFIGWNDNGGMFDWMPNGMRCAEEDTLTDIISEWVEPERIPWEHLPKWCKWWAKDRDGTECGYEHEPSIVSSVWAGNEESGQIYLPAMFFSNYTGDWRNSLRERPEGV